MHLNIRMATGCVDAIFKAQFAILLTSLKLTVLKVEEISHFECSGELSEW